MAAKSSAQCLIHPSGVFFQRRKEEEGSSPALNTSAASRGDVHLTMILYCCASFSARASPNLVRSRARTEISCTHHEAMYDCFTPCETLQSPLIRSLLHNSSKLVSMFSKLVKKICTRRCRSIELLSSETEANKENKTVNRVISVFIFLRKTCAEAEQNNPPSTTSI